jgi:branched-subunit amino acid transport protein AzlD
MQPSEWFCERSSLWHHRYIATAFTGICKNSVHTCGKAFPIFYFQMACVYLDSPWNLKFCVAVGQVLGFRPFLSLTEVALKLAKRKTFLSVTLSPPLWLYLVYTSALQPNVPILGTHCSNTAL